MKTTDWVEINNENCPTLEKYGVKPFKIMKRKMRDEGSVWNNINYYDAKAEAKKLGYRLPTENEMKALREHYKNTQTKVSIHDKEFLGIEELSYDEKVFYEWLEGGFIRGGAWNNGSDDGAFTLHLYLTPSFTNNSLGFRLTEKGIFEEKIFSRKSWNASKFKITSSNLFHFVLDLCHG